MSVDIRLRVPLVLIAVKLFELLRAVSPGTLFDEFFEITAFG
jgi:hypothetical protein